MIIKIDTFGQFRLTSFGFLFTLFSILLSNNSYSASKDYTTETRYDLTGKVTGIIAPDPDGSGPLGLPATRYTYGHHGLLNTEERGSLLSSQPNSIKPKDWSGFTVYSSTSYTYDAWSRKLTEKHIDPDSSEILSVTQYSYNDSGQLECTAIRMNPDRFSSLPASACTLGPDSEFGEDRITKYIYDSSFRVETVIKALGTSLEQNYASYTYNKYWQKENIIDANNNLTYLEYNSLGRLYRFHYPSKTNTGTYSKTDYEQYGYDDNGNLVQLRKRDGITLDFSFDKRNRMFYKQLPGNTQDVLFSYDNLGNPLSTYFKHNNDGIFNKYDGFGRVVSSITKNGGIDYTIKYKYDKNSNRIAVWYPDNKRFDYKYDFSNRITELLENGTTKVMEWKYLNGGKTQTVIRNGVNSDMAFDAFGRLEAFSHNPSGSTFDVAYNFKYNPANQLDKQDFSNLEFMYIGDDDLRGPYKVNGLNQYTTVGSKSFAYDLNGNLKSDGIASYTYDTENRLITASGPVSAALDYDPLGRMSKTTISGATIKYVYDGNALIAEYSSSGALLKRYVHGVGSDKPILEYTGSNVSSSTRKYLLSNQQGSIIATTNSSGVVETVNTYDPYGIPDPSNAGRFGYTAQLYLPELGLYYYKARVYSPKLGRFLQTDPVGYQDQMNLYSYVGNDPMNMVDPSGMSSCPVNDKNCIEDVATEKGTEQQPPPTDEDRAIEEVVVTGYKSKSFSDGTKIRFPGGMFEQGFNVSENGIFPQEFTRSGTQNCDDGSERAANTLNISNLNGASIGHTHGGRALDPLPGPEDGQAAAATGRPAYMISRRGAFSIESTAVGFRVRHLAGKPLTSSERRAIRKTVANYNRTGGGSGANCTFTPD